MSQRKRIYLAPYVSIREQNTFGSLCLIKHKMYLAPFVIKSDKIYLAPYVIKSDKIYLAPYVIKSDKIYLAPHVCKIIIFVKWIHKYL